MHIELDITGDVVERQELLNGTTILTLQGATADGSWTMSGLVGWNIGTQRDQSAGEGDLTLALADGAEIFATVTRAVITDIEGGPEAAADHIMRLEYEIDGGSGAFEGAAGSAIADGALAADMFSAKWAIEISDA